jgi:hypothetical protein
MMVAQFFTVLLFCSRNQDGARHDLMFIDVLE